MAQRWTAPNRNAYKTGLRGNVYFILAAGQVSRAYAVACVNLLEPQTELKVPATENGTRRNTWCGTVTAFGKH